MFFYDILYNLLMRYIRLKIYYWYGSELCIIYSIFAVYNESPHEIVKGMVSREEDGVVSNKKLKVL